MNIVMGITIACAVLYIFRSVLVYIVPALLEVINTLIKIICMVFMAAFNLLIGVFKFIFRIKPKVVGTTTVTDVVKKKVKGADGILRERVQIMNRRYDVDKNGKIIK